MSMKLFEIWCEGHQATGDSSDAGHLGWMVGEDFKDACKNFASIDPAFKRYFDPEHMTYWGCKLFDNEGDARKSFG